MFKNTHLNYGSTTQELINMYDFHIAMQTLNHSNLDAVSLRAVNATTGFVGVFCETMYRKF